MDRVQRAQQHGRELTLADPALPAERREHDVHQSGRASTRCSTPRTARGVMPPHAAAVLSSRSSTRRRGRSLARRPSRACTCTWRPGTGTASGSVRGSSWRRSRTSTASHDSWRRLVRCVAHGAPVAKTCSITSSIGGSSTVRSCTSCSASSSRRRARGLRASAPAARRARRPRAPPRSSCTRAKRSAERSQAAPSNRIRPWWMTITRLQSASTSAM